MCGILCREPDGLTQSLAPRPINGVLAANSAHVLKLSHVSSGCGNFLKNGDTWSFNDSYTVSPKQKITSA